MVMDAEVAKLVHEHVLDAVKRCLHKLEIEQNVSCLSAATPAPGHRPDDNRRRRHA